MHYSRKRRKQSKNNITDIYFTTHVYLVVANEKIKKYNSNTNTIPSLFTVNNGKTKKGMRSVQS